MTAAATLEVKSKAPAGGLQAGWLNNNNRTGRH
jgi:hypothetical protein